MTFVAGHTAKVYISPDNITYTQVDANEATINVSREIIDITTLGDVWREKIQGIKDWSVTLPNFWQSAGVVSGALRNHVLLGDPLYIRIDVDGTANNRFSGVVISEGFEIGLNLTDAISSSQTLQGNGALTATFTS